MSTTLDRLNPDMVNWIRGEGVGTLVNSEGQCRSSLTRLTSMDQHHNDSTPTPTEPTSVSSSARSTGSIVPALVVAGAVSLSPGATYVLSPEQFARCEQFAAEVTPTTSRMYTFRGSTAGAEKFQRDAAYGKAAEVAVAELAKNDSTNVTDPDFEIHGAGRKSFAADLTVAGRPVHVKSVVTGSPYGVSWVFTTNDPLVKKPAPGELVVFCTYEVVSRTVTIVSTLASEHLAPLFKPMKLAHLRGSKVAIYAEDLSPAVPTKE